MGVQVYVSLSVGMWRANANPKPYTNLNVILHAHPHLPWCSFDPMSPNPLSETPKAEGHHF